MLGSLTIVVAHHMYSMPPYPYLATDYGTQLSLITHHMWIGGFLIVGAAAHAAIFMVRDYDPTTRYNDLLDRVLRHRDAIISHLNWACIFLGFHSFGLYIHNDTMSALGRPQDMFSDTAIKLQTIFAQWIQNTHALAPNTTAPGATTSTNLNWGGSDLVAVGGKVALLPIPLGTADFLVHHIHAFTIHVTVLILLKGVLFARSSRLIPDKANLGFRFPYDGPGRGGTCQVSAWDHVFLGLFWMYNAILVVIFHFSWKMQSDVWGSINDQGVVTHITGGNFAQSSITINAWLRDFLWAQASKVAPATQPKALSIIQGRAVGVTHYLLGGIATTWAFSQGLAQDPTTRRFWFGIATAHDFESHDDITEERLYQNFFASHFGQLAFIFLWTSGNLFHVAWQGNFESWVQDPLHGRPISHAIWDPHFGQPAVEAFTRGGALGPVNIAYSGVYQWWYTIGLRTNQDLYTGALFLLFISVISLLGGWLHLQPKWKPSVSWFKNAESRLNHHLSGLFGVSSLAWIGHLVHVAIPGARGESVGWNNFLNVLPHPQGLGPLFTEKQILIEPIFAQWIQSAHGKTSYGFDVLLSSTSGSAFYAGRSIWFPGWLNAVNESSNSLFLKIGPGDFLVHHAIALGLHTTTLILVKGALDARGSKLMPDKKDFGYSFPCDGPGRGGTCDISAWDAFYLAVFWMLNTIGWVTFYWHWKHITLWQGNVSQFNESSTYLMGWLRDYLWLNSSQLINGYNPFGMNSLSVWAWMFLFGHLVWATGFMFLILWRGYWQEMIETLAWAHERTPLANLIRWRDKPVALSIVQARLVGLAHFSVGYIFTYAAFLIASTSGKFG
uniref:photosystem I n=1 Tax=Chenopodium quinoa TaxID=63459 RepID=A0A803N322_CHEQI